MQQQAVNNKQDLNKDKTHFIKRVKRDRNISGVLILNKNRGITSNRALQEARTLFLAAKGGHTGNLDPLAEGVLPICFGEATKFSQFLFDADKSYRAKIKLGVTTDSGDADGTVIATNDVPKFSFTEMEDILQEFTGDITQIPSMFSAIKHNGKPLYKYARAGVEVERKSRVVKIYKLDLLACMSDEIIIDVRCSKGTYIRSLAEDIGKRLGCGAHVTDLLRTSVGPFSLDQSLSLDYIANVAGNSSNENNNSIDKFKDIDSLVLAPESLLYQLPRVDLCDITSHYIKQGNPVFIAKITYEVGTELALFSKKTGNLLGVGKVLDDGKIAPKRLVSLV